MSKQHKKTKGTIIVDEGVKREYAKIAQEEGWKIILIPPSNRNIGLSDKAIVRKYTKNIPPVFTNDKTSYKEYSFTEKEIGRSGFIIHVFVKPEEEKEYIKQIKYFFRTYTEKFTHGAVWTINKKGKPTKKELTITKQTN